MRKKRVGILGGSFDPLHFGHLNMAIALLESHGLDTVLFCPARVSPFKMKSPYGAAPEHRLAMVRCGIQKIPHFSILDWEINHTGPSYTIDTIKHLKNESDADLFLLLGEDQLPDLHNWKEVDHLFSLCTPLIASRKINRPLSLLHLSSPVHSLISQGRTKIPIMEISSTTIRERLSQKKSCQHLVPDLILDYIERHQLYY
jgi:nicotinate-nucleotide adenylyltransferase